MTMDGLLTPLIFLARSGENAGLDTGFFSVKNLTLLTLVIGIISKVYDTVFQAAKYVKDKLFPVKILEKEYRLVISQAAESASESSEPTKIGSAFFQKYMDFIWNVFEVESSEETAYEDFRGNITKRYSDLKILRVSDSIDEDLKAHLEKFLKLVKFKYERTSNNAYLIFTGPFEVIRDFCRKVNTTKFNENTYLTYYSLGSSVPPRIRAFAKNECTFDNVYLDPDIKNEIIRRLDVFVSSLGRQARKTANIPDMLGFLLYGPPGTGKTSIAYAIAHRLKRSVIIISDITKIPPYAALGNHVILLDDMDTHGPMTRTDSEKSEFHNKKIGEILDMLNGRGCFYGTVVVATTNKIENFEEAIKRRFAVQMHIGKMSHEVAEKRFLDIIRVQYPDYEIPRGFELKDGISPVEMNLLIGEDLETVKKKYLRKTIVVSPIGRSLHLKVLKPFQTDAFPLVQNGKISIPVC